MGNQMKAIFHNNKIYDEILDTFVKNDIEPEDAKSVLWVILTSIYETELIEYPSAREKIIDTVENQKETLLINILGTK
ncbi:MAG: hypothetical protein WAM14_16710 [Candidatus Nitrosopolaris sp.]